MNLRGSYLGLCQPAFIRSAHMRVSRSTSTFFFLALMVCLIALNGERPKPDTPIEGVPFADMAGVIPPLEESPGDSGTDSQDPFYLGCAIILSRPAEQCITYDEQGQRVDNCGNWCVERGIAVNGLEYCRSDTSCCCAPPS